MEKIPMKKTPKFYMQLNYQLLSKYDSKELKTVKLPKCP